jgi:hypothetical protein
MEVTPVTPNGVRDGDPTALVGLVARRGPAVLAFCREVCGADVAPRAAAEAFARFRAAVHDTGVPVNLDPEALLLGATRHAAASMAEIPENPVGLLRRPDGACAHVPTLLAARAAGALGTADQERLARHFQRCVGCHAIESAFARAERSYAAPGEGELDDRTIALLVATLQSAAPVAPEFAPDPSGEPFADGQAPGSDFVVAGPAPMVDEPRFEHETVAEPAAAEEHAAEEPEAAVADPAVAEEPVSELPAAVDEPVAEDAPDDTAPLEPSPAEEPFDEGDEDALDGSEELLYDDEDWDPEGTVEWDVVAEQGPISMVPAAGPHDELSIPPPPPRLTPDGRAAVSLEGGRLRRGRFTGVVRLVLPVLVVAAGVVAALGFAGVFGGDPAAPPTIREQAAAPRVAPPVTTPLPVTVATASQTPIPGTTAPAGATVPGQSTTSTTTTPAATSTTPATGTSTTP